MATKAKKSPAAAPALTTQITMLPLSQLKKSPANVRTYPPTAIEALADSLLAEGVLQNLVVSLDTQDNRYCVDAGERRRLALASLVKAKKLPADALVPCQVVTANRAHVVSLTENQLREAMHPADQFEAFRRLIDGEGLSLEEAAARMGVDAKFVAQRMKLAKVAPELLGAYRGGAMRLDQLEAFTVCEDQQKQRMVWKEISDAPVNSWKRSNASYIRDALIEEYVDGDSDLAIFVGLDAYKAAGGEVAQDLFGDPDDEDASGLFLTNHVLLKHLALAKLQTMVPTIEAEGWKWVITATNWTYGDSAKFSEAETVERKPNEQETAEQLALAAEKSVLEKLDELTDEQDERLAEIDDRLEELADLYETHPAQIPHAGAVLTIGDGGKIDVLRGLIRREDVKAAEAALPREKPKKTKPNAKPAEGDGDDDGDDNTEAEEGLRQARERAAHAALMARRMSNRHRLLAALKTAREYILADGDGDHDAVMAKIAAAIEEAEAIDLEE